MATKRRWKDRPDLRKMVEDAIASSQTMCEAATKIGMKLDTLRHYAKQFELWNPNVGGRGLKKPWSGASKAISLESILEGKFPSVSTGNLKRKLLKAGIKQNRCDVCGISEWQGKEIVCQLDHINGISFDHRLENLRMLCPNCHSQTTTYAGRNSRASVDQQ